MESSYVVKMSLMVSLVFVMSIGVSTGEWYRVGDEASWTNKGHVDYDKWADYKNFKIGDTLQFVNKKGFFGVLRVTCKNYNACNATFPYSISLFPSLEMIPTPSSILATSTSFVAALATVKSDKSFHIRVRANNTSPTSAVLPPPPIEWSPPHHDNYSPAPLPPPVDRGINSPAPEVVTPPSPSPSPSPSPFPGGGEVWLTSVVLLAFCACGFVF